MRSTSSSALALVPVSPVLDAAQVVGEAVSALAGVVEGDSLVALSSVDLLELTAVLHRVTDRVTALAVEATGHLHGRDAARVEGFTSTSRWLEVRAGLAPGAATATVARGEALHRDFAATRGAWLAGAISEGAVREITTAIPRRLRGVPADLLDAERARIETVALTVAATRSVREVRHAITRVAILTDPDGADAAVLAAHEAQFLRFTPAPHGMDVRGFLSTESAAAVLTVFDQHVDSLHRTGTLTREDRDGLDAPTPGLRAWRREHLNARALTGLATRLLDTGDLGRRHDQRPHVTVTVHADDHHDGLGAIVRLHGFGPVPVPTTSTDRILCDAEIHPVLTTTQSPPPRAGREGHEHTPAPVGTITNSDFDVDTILDTDDNESWVRRLLGQHGRHVLDVGRSFRTAPPKIRRALEIRDQHCTFPDCRIDPSRCEAHHVQHWQHGGATSLANMTLLCPGHHHLVHEGRWSITARDGHDPGHPDYWAIAPLPPREPDRCPCLDM